MGEVLANFGAGLAAVIAGLAGLALAYTLTTDFVVVMGGIVFSAMVIYGFAFIWRGVQLYLLEP